MPIKVSSHKYEIRFTSTFTPYDVNVRLVVDNGIQSDTFEILVNCTMLLWKNQTVTFECPIAKEEIVMWQIGSKKIENSTWLPVETEEFKANVLSEEVNILNITLLSNNDLRFSCQSINTTTFLAIPIYNDSGNLYPSSETPNPIKDEIFTLKCNTVNSGATVTWYTGNGTVIAKYSGTCNENYTKYFDSRQETSCQERICTLNITNVSLAEDNMSIICSTGFHTSLFNIRVFYPPQVNLHISNKTNNITINCSAFDGNPDNHTYKLEQKWGNVTKNTYDMRVLPINNSTLNDTVKPTFSSLSNGSKIRNVSKKETVIFKQCFYSHPKSDVKWQKNEELIDSNKYLITDYLQDEFPFKGSCTSLKREDIKDDDIGTYTLTVENSIGKKTAVFTLRYKENVSLDAVIGCTVGSVLLLITLGFLAYKFHIIRGVKNNKDTSSTEDEENAYATLSLVFDKQENTCATISHASDNEENAYATISLVFDNVDNAGVNVFKKPDTMEKQYAKTRGPVYLEMQSLDREGVYVNISQKPGEQNAETSEPEYIEMKQPFAIIPLEVMEEEQYAEASGPEYLELIPPAMEEEQYAEVSGPIYLELTPTIMDGVYANVSQKPNAMEEEQYAEVSGPVYLELTPTTMEEEQYAEASGPEYLEMIPRVMDDVYANVSLKPNAQQFTLDISVTSVTAAKMGGGEESYAEASGSKYFELIPPSYQ
ncbi:XP_029636814.1uncharacterized protein LOC115212114 [Octopus vulgaris]|uniref:XP_029636814.1uncharacterized protein LOC115212114 n=1 Tax=Octopus vulgaris TaxID=6645 RepID=A0AA36AWL0_OCTVU|nr:XP_029636814.1uncharacterized protein LOC115212114 [Octopus vulgaris]